MKQITRILTAIFFCVLMSLPLTVYAETYHLGGTDMSIQVDDSLWYVFTRDNIKNNSELEELGISYDYMSDVFNNNEAYMDAILVYEDGEYVELIIRKKLLDTGVANLTNYENDEVLELASGLGERQNTENFSVYENNYKFAKVEYTASDLGYYVCEFVTIVNKENYTLTFQSTSQFTDAQYVEIENIVDSIEFDVDTTLKEKKNTSFWENVIEETIIGAIVGAVSGVIIRAVSKKKKKAKNNEEAPFTDTME